MDLRKRTSISKPRKAVSVSTAPIIILVLMILIKKKMAPRKVHQLELNTFKANRA
jgi:hypothetical protein